MVVLALSLLFTTVCWGLVIMKILLLLALVRPSLACTGVDSQCLPRCFVAGCVGHNEHITELRQTYMMLLKLFIEKEFLDHLDASNSSPVRLFLLMVAYFFHIFPLALAWTFLPLGMDCKLKAFLT